MIYNLKNLLAHNSETPAILAVDEDGFLFIKREDGSMTRLGEGTDTLPYGEINLTASAATTVAADSTYYKAAGTYALNQTAGSLRLDSPSNGRLRYTGQDTTVLKAHFTATLEVVGNNQLCRATIAQNGVPIVEAASRVKIGTGTDAEAVSGQQLVLAAPNDYFELWVGNWSSAGDITVQTSSLILLGTGAV